MEKELFIENKYDELESELKIVNKIIDKDNFNGALLTTLFALPTVALIGSNLPVVFGLGTLSLLVSSSYISKSIRNLNKKNYIDKREEYIDELEVNDNSMIDKEKISKIIHNLRNKNFMNSIDLEGSKFFSKYSKFICLLFVVLSSVSSNIGFNIGAIMFLISSVSSDVLYTISNKKELLNNLKIDNYSNLIDCSVIDSFEKSREFHNKSKRVVYDVVDDKNNYKTINEISIDKYLESLSNDNDYDISKKLIKTK